jgi:hypothetical protein
MVSGSACIHGVRQCGRAQSPRRHRPTGVATNTLDTRLLALLRGADPCPCGFLHHALASLTSRLSQPCIPTTHTHGSYLTTPTQRCRQHPRWLCPRSVNSAPAEAATTGRAHPPTNCPPLHAKNRTPTDLVAHRWRSPSTSVRKNACHSHSASPA